MSDCEFRENRCKLIRTFQIYFPIWVKFRNRCLGRKLLSYYLVVFVALRTPCRCFGWNAKRLAQNSGKCVVCFVRYERKAVLVDSILGALA
jgi:hypothetical protein